MEGHIEAMSMFNNRNELKGANKMKTRTQGTIDDFLTSKRDSAAKKTNTSNENDTVGNATTISGKGRKCVGITNSTHGSDRKSVPLVHKCMNIQPTSSYGFDCFQNEPAIFSKKCDGLGKLKVTDGGLSFYECMLLRRKQGNSAPCHGLQNAIIK